MYFVRACICTTFFACSVILISSVISLAALGKYFYIALLKLVEELLALKA